MVDSGRVPQYGKRLLNAVVAERVAKYHERPNASIPKSFAVSDGFRDISYATLPNAVNRCAHSLEESFGKPGEKNTITYIGPSDMRYQLLSLGAVKSGHVVGIAAVTWLPWLLMKCSTYVLLKPKKHIRCPRQLFDDAEVAMIITPPNPSKVVQNIVDQRSMHHVQIGPLDDFLDEAAVAPRPFTGAFDEYRSKPWVKLHTSGSTGFPKIVVIKHGLVSAVDSYHNLEHNEAAARYGGMIWQDHPGIPYRLFFAGVLGFCWIAVGNTGDYVVWIIAFGFVSGMVVTLPPAVLPYLCPSLAVVGTRLGMLYAVAGIGFLISSPVALALNDTSNGFLGAQCWIGACCLAAVAFYTITAVEAWKRRRLYQENGRRRTYLLRKSDPEKGM